MSSMCDGSEFCVFTNFLMDGNPIILLNQKFNEILDLKNMASLIERMSFVERSVLDSYLSGYARDDKVIASIANFKVVDKTNLKNNSTTHQLTLTTLENNSTTDQSTLTTLEKIVKCLKSFAYWAIGLSASHLAGRVMEYKKPKNVVTKGPGTNDYGIF